MAEASGEKTEEPTDKKIDDSRKKGQVWKSRDLTGVAVFLAGLGLFKVMWPTMQDEFAKLFLFAFERVAHPSNLEHDTYQLMLMGLGSTLLLTLPIAFGCALIGGLVDFLQVGPLVAVEGLTPKLDKLNPIAGLKNMFSKKQLVELLKSMLKISVTGYVVYGVVRDAAGLVVGTVQGDAALTLAVLGELIFRVTVRVGLLFLAFSIFDVWFQHRTWRKELMMTKDEVKREYKESEGDPHHKSRRRELHQEILEGEQMAAVESADAVITNPTHLAVAIRYRQGELAPFVVCKGAGDKAASIRACAERSGVAIFRNVPLAHALYPIAEGDAVPEELYGAVAEVLSFLYSLSGRALG